MCVEADGMPVVEGLLYDGPAGAWERVYTNPAELLGTTESACLRPHIGGRASDYEAWADFCCMLSAGAGHPQYGRCSALLQSLHAWHPPLEAADSWQRCVRRLGESTVRLPELAALCGGRFWPGLRLDRTLNLWDGVEDLTTLEASLAQHLEPCGHAHVTHVLWVLPAEYAFVRPNLYSASRYLQLALAGRDGAGESIGMFPGAGALTAEQRWHLLSQLLRLLARLCKERGVTLELCGRWEALRSLTEYLQGAVGLTDMYLWISDPLHMCATEPFRDRVGLWLRGSDAPASVREALSAYATCCPIGRSPGVRISIKDASDLAQIPILRRTLTDLLDMWGQHMEGPDDPSAKKKILTRLLTGKDEEAKIPCE